MKTAVEQLMIDSFGENFRMTINDYQLNAFQKALEKEKEQIIDAYYGKINGVFGYRKEGEQYYNQTYNQNK